MKSLKTKKELLAFIGKTRSRFAKFFSKASTFLFKKNKKGLLNNFDREQADKNLVYTLATSKIPSSQQMKHLNKTLSKKESWIIRIALVVVLINLVYLGVRFYNKHITLIPVSGGTYYEGVLGYPRNINPLYDVNRDVDRDLARLIYSSLYKYDENGQLVGDLAQDITTDDNKSFVITVRNDVKWHSGDTLTVDDIIFTFRLITNPEYNSPLRKNFSDVQLEKISDNQIKFTLSSAYAAFPHLLTFGVLPQSVWENTSPDAASLTELNLQAVGSGPYKFESLLKSKQGDIKEYRLVINDDYYGTKPYIRNVVFKFYQEPGELIEALNGGDVLGISYLPLEQRKLLLTQNSLNFNSLNSSQEDLIFFNQENNKNLADLKVRQALALAIDRQAIVKDIFDDFYKVINGPLPISSFAYTDEVTKYDFNQDAANAKLDEAGWSKIEISDENLNNDSPEVKAIRAYASSTAENVYGTWRFKKDSKNIVTILSVKLSFVDSSKYLQVSQKIKESWEAIGVKTILTSTTNTEIPNLASSRSFEALIFGEILGGDPDIFVFWHSSQAGGKGLNISAYKNDQVDKLLEEARGTVDRNLRIEKYQQVQKIIAEELPAIFLYEKNYIYIQNKKLKGFKSTAVISASDRLAGITNWFVKYKNKFNW